MGTNTDLLVLLLLVLVVLLGSALCSGVEAALLTVNPIRIHELAARSRPIAGARRLANSGSVWVEPSQCWSSRTTDSIFSAA